MDKKTYFIGGLLVILVVLIGVVFFFLKSDHNLDKQDIKNSVSLASIKLDGDKIIEKFNVAIDGKDKNFEIEYDYIKDEYYGAIRGKITDIKDKIQFKSTDEEIDRFISDNFNESKIHDMIDIDDFRFIKGQDDKTYLLVIVRTEHFVSGENDFLYVFNDNLELVTGDVDYNGCLNDQAFTIVSEASGHKSEEEPGKSGYKDESNILGYKDSKEDFYLNLKIEDDKIYYLKAKQNITGEEDYGTLEERIYTIKNDKLEYTVKNKFKITWVAGQAC